MLIKERQAAIGSDVPETRVPPLSTECFESGSMREKLMAGGENDIHLYISGHLDKS